MSATPLPGLLGAVAPVLDNYGYLAVAGLILVENFGVPAPGETILVAAWITRAVLRRRRRAAAEPGSLPDARKAPDARNG